MTHVLIESAVRSLVLALAVWLGLRIFRIRNVVAEKLAWTVVLAAALAMPLMAPLMARMAAATVTLPARTILAVQAVLPAQAFQNRLDQGRLDQDRLDQDRQDQGRQETMQPASASAAQPAPMAGMVSGADRAVATLGAGGLDRFAQSEAAAPVGPIDRFPDPKIEHSDQDAPPAAPARNGWPEAAGLATVAYLAVAGALLFRLLFGLAFTISLWRSAEPVEGLPFAAGLCVRSSASLGSPVTFGSGILLPAGFTEWDSEKLRIVLAHERSHIRQGDFYLQLLAGLYAAAVWVSPVGWWLKRKLSDLGEAIGDRSGVEEARSHSSYAQVLLEFAAAPRPTTIGVAMARPSSLARRIERLLNPSAFRQAFAGGRRAFLAAVLVPAAMFAATALVRVEAASQPAQQTPPATAQQPVNNSAQNGQAHSETGKLVPAPGAAAAALPAQAAAPQEKTDWPLHINIPAVHVDVPAQHIDVPAVHVDVPAVHVNVPERHIDVPAVHVDVPAQHFDVLAQHIDVPAVHVDVPAQHIDVPAIHVDVPAKHIDVPPAGAQNTYGPNHSDGELLAMLGVGEGLGLGNMSVQPAGRAQAEATFDRTLSLTGKLDLRVATGSGHIHITRGTANQLHVHATIRSNEAEDAEEVRSLAANPPIEQDGNTIRIGNMHREQGTNHISIDYDIEAPADAALDAATGSGEIVDQGVGRGAKLQTGSGNITATGLTDGFKAQTGSGNISVENSGQGEATAQTGSGDIEVKSVDGALKAQTGSGSIKIAGKPSADWRVETGSGDVELQAADAPLTLDASTSSGSITTAQPLTAEVSSGHHHVRGQLNGGGPTVRIETGSGDIRID